MSTMHSPSPEDYSPEDEDFADEVSHGGEDLECTDVVRAIADAIAALDAADVARTKAILNDLLRALGG